VGAAALGAGGESRRRRTAAGLPDLAENGRPCTVLSAGCTGRTQVLQGTHLRVQVGEAGAGEGRTAATVRNRGRRKAGKRGRRGRRGSSLQGGALAAACGGSGTARRRLRLRWQPRGGGEGFKGDVVESPKLFQLKRASHGYTGDLNSTHFKRNNPWVCRVTA
jgi:hypothetical protein